MTPTYAALEHTFALESGSSEMRQFLQRALRSLIAEAVPKVRYRVNIDEAGDQVSISVGDAELVRAKPTPAIAQLMSAINVAAIRTAGSMPVLHASSVALGGRAVVIPAAPGSGKSTLCAALVSRGATYLTDEAVPVDELGRALPYPKPIVVGRGSWPVLSAWVGAAPTLGDRLQAWYLDPTTFGAPVAREPIPIKAVVMPRYRDGEPTRVERLSRAETTAAMASNTFNLHDHGREAVERFAALTTTAPGLRVTFGVIQEACELIESLLEES